jgi:DNA-binding response OmpR family regulator
MRRRRRIILLRRQPGEIQPAIQAGLRQGARAYITKPVDPAELQAKIDALG